MIEYKGDEKIDHGAIPEGDMHRAKRKKVDAVQKLLEFGSRAKSINKTVSQIRNGNVPSSLKTPGGKIRSVDKKAPSNALHEIKYHVDTQFKPGFGVSYWFKNNGTTSQTKWQITKSDYLRYDQKNCYRTQEEAAKHRFPSEE